MREASISHYLKILVFVLVMAVSSYRPNDGNLTESKKQAAEKEIEALAEKLASAISGLDAEGVTSLFGKSADSSYISDGIFVPVGKLKDAFKRFFADFQELSFTFEQKRVRTFSPTSGALIGWAHYKGLMKDGRKVDEHAIFSLLCFRERGNWRIFQAHRSLILSSLKSETSKARPRLTQFCRGNGIDLGYGGDPIVPSAITMDLPTPYTSLGSYPQNLAGDARDLYWFKDNVLDYVYSSHLLEDFPRNDTAAVIGEWLRIIKPDGFLVLYGPDEQAYRAYCKEKGMPPNASHKIDDFGLKYVKKILEQNFRDRYSILHEIELIDTYCFDLVIKKLK